MNIKEVYEKYKSKSRYILSGEWGFIAELKDEVIREMWQAIKEEVEGKK